MTRAVWKILWLRATAQRFPHAYTGSATQSSTFGVFNTLGKGSTVGRNDTPVVIVVVVVVIAFVIVSVTDAIISESRNCTDSGVAAKEIDVTASVNSDATSGTHGN